MCHQNTLFELDRISGLCHFATLKIDFRQWLQPNPVFSTKCLAASGGWTRKGLQTVVQRLARERSFLETLFNTIEDGVLVVDEQGG